MSGTVFHVITAVWGREFIDLFLTTGIPNQLAAGNLAALPPGSRYRILATAADQARLESADQVRAVRALLPVDIVVMADDPLETSKYDRMIRYHRRAVGDALRDGAALIFLAPDHLLATGTMARLVDRRAAGYRAVVCAAPALSQESMLAALTAYGACDLPPRTLVRMALDHLHPVNLTYMADATTFSRHPAVVFWRVDGGGLLARYFTFHPLMIDPERHDLPRREIDGEYVWRSIPNFAAVYAVTDSDDITAFQLMTTRDVVADGRKAWSKVWRTARLANLCNPHQLAYWDRPVRFHFNDLGPAWDDAERDSARFAAAVLQRLPYVRLMFPLTNRVSRWQQRWDRRAREWRQRLPRVRLKRIRRPWSIAIHRARKRVRRAFRT